MTEPIKDTKDKADARLAALRTAIRIGCHWMLLNDIEKHPELKDDEWVKECLGILENIPAKQPKRFHMSNVLFISSLLGEEHWDYHIRKILDRAVTVFKEETVQK